MSDNIKASIHRHEGQFLTRFSMDVAEIALQKMGPEILRQFTADVEKKLVERWIEEHGTEVLAKLTADAVAKQVQKAIEDRVAKILLSRV